MLQEIRETLQEKISENDKVLDFGGWHSPINRANTVIDIVSCETRCKDHAVFTDIWPAEHFTKESYFQLDIYDTPWTFKDKEFDFSICSHTLEDIRDPISVCWELNRVSKAGYIEVPSRITESTRGGRETLLLWILPPPLAL